MHPICQGSICRSYITSPHVSIKLVSTKKKGSCTQYIIFFKRNSEKIYANIKCYYYQEAKEKGDGVELIQRPLNKFHNYGAIKL